MKKAMIKITILFIVVLSFTACAPQPKHKTGKALSKEPYFKNFTLYDDVEYYASFPKIVKTSSEIIVYYSIQNIEKLQAQELHSHYQPLLEYRYSISADNAETWTHTDQPPALENVQDATRALVALEDGRLLDAIYRYIPGTKKCYPNNAKIYHKTLNAAPLCEYPIPQCEFLKSNYLWDIRPTADGSLLAAAYGYKPEIPDTFLEGKQFNEKWPQDYTTLEMAFFKGTPDGKNWQYLSRIENNHAWGMAEPNILAFPNGRVVVMIRAEWHRSLRDILPDQAHGNDRSFDGYGYYLYQAQSSDGGKTWSEPVNTGIWGHPAYLLQLDSGAVLMVYGHRRPPYSVRAILSYDQCRTWDISTMKTLRNFDQDHMDMGYPVAVQLDDGNILCTYYGHSTEKPGFDKPHGIYASVFNQKWLETP